MLRRSFTTVLFTVFAASVIVGDLMLWKAVETMKNEETMKISIRGAQGHVSKSVIRITDTFEEVRVIVFLCSMSTDHSFES